METTLYLQVFKRGWWIIVLTVLVSTNMSLVVSYFSTPIYQSNSKFIVSPNAGIYENTWDIVSSIDTLDKRSIITTYKELLISPSVYGSNPVFQTIDPEVMATDYTLSVVVLPETNILNLMVEGPDPRQVAIIADAIGTNGVLYMNKMYPYYNFSVLEKPEIPTEPVRPLPIQNAALAALFGGIIGVVLAFFREQLQNTVEKLRERSIFDTVTSAYTRAYFERRLLEEITQHPESNISLGLINLRGLEEVSNIIPQPILDRLLNAVTQTLKNELRGRDIVGRWDTSKLAVLLPSTPSSAVEATFKRIQLYLAESISIDNSGEIVVLPNPCIGATARDPLESGDEFIHRAELAMEKASALKSAAVVFLTKPFLFIDSSELIK
jgi:diguanylate cyclase (GGDEF)-like protein